MDRQGTADSTVNPLLHRRRLSIKGLSFAVLGLIAVCSTLIAFISGEYFYRSALDAQFASLNRVIEVEAGLAMRRAHTDANTIGQSIAQNPSFISAFQNAIARDSTTELVHQLDDPFISGFVGAREVDLVRLRAYTTTLRPVAASSLGSDRSTSDLPYTLYRKADARRGADLVKAIGSLWQSPDGPRYSVLVPIGGLDISGYLEVVIDPARNLHSLAGKLQIPIDVRSGDGKRLLSGSTGEHRGLTPVDYIMPADDGSAAYRLTGYEDLSSLNARMRQIQRTSVFGFLLFGAIAMLAAIWLLHHYLFAPVRRLLEETRSIAEGNRSAAVQPSGLREVAVLADAFNHMNNEVRERTEELHRLSVMDPLTGIGNRRLFDQVLERDYRKALREQRPLSLLLIDVDYFKRFNDNYGHQAGDECLQAIAIALHNTAHRPGDLAARYGGEEFAIILPDTPIEGLQQVAQNVRTALAALNIRHADSPTGLVTVSIGGATLIPHEGTNTATLLTEADRALYQVKGSGRDNVLAYELNRLRGVGNHTA